MAQEHVLIVLAALLRELEVHAEGGLDNLVGGVESDVGETVLVAYEAVLLFAVVLGHGDGGHAEEGELEAGTAFRGDGHVAARHQLGHVGHVVVDVEVVVAVKLEQLLDIVLGTSEGHDEVHVLVLGLRDDVEQTVGIVLRIGTSEGDEDALHLILDLDGFVEHEGLAADVVLLARMDLGELVVLVEGVDDEVGLLDALAVVLEVDELRLRQYGAQSDHIVDGGGEDVVDEDGVLFAAADVEEFGDAVDGLQRVGSMSEHLGVGLVLVVEDIRLDEELVGNLEGTVDVADASLVVTIDVDGDLGLAEGLGHALQVGEGVDILRLALGHLEDVDLLADARLGGHHAALGDDEGACLHITGRQVLTVQALLVVGHLTAVLHAPGEVRGIDGGDEGVEIVVDGVLDGTVEGLYLQRGRCGLHGDDIVPCAFRDGICHDGIECDCIAAEALIPPLMAYAHLGGDDPHLG